MDSFENNSIRPASTVSKIAVMTANNRERSSANDNMIKKSWDSFSSSKPILNAKPMSYNNVAQSIGSNLKDNFGVFVD